jgi:hypothetical protein
MKRILLILILLPVAVFAQDPSSDMDLEQLMGELNKQRNENSKGLTAGMKQITIDSITEMEQSKTCLINTQDQAGLDQCLNSMDASLKKEIVNSVTSTQGGNARVNQQSLVYSEEVKQQLIQKLDGWIQTSQASLACYEQPNGNLKTIKNCVDNISAGSGGNTSAPPSVGRSPQSMPSGGDDQLSGDW